MMQTIRIERLLRESVQTPYCDLVTRSTGRAVRISIQQALVAADSPVVVIDFSEVGLVDLSCADEIVAKLVLDLPRRTCLVLQGLREEQLEAIEHVLEHRALAALVCDLAGSTARPVGRVSPDLRTAFFTLQALGAATTQALADRVGWTVSRTTEVLETLLQLRLVRADADRFAVPLSA
jgi:hypothetical protein